MVAPLFRRWSEISLKQNTAAMVEKAIISNLRLKFAEKTWNETFQLVRRCMEKSRDESKPCEPLVRCLERLQKEFNAPSMNATRSRLEMIAKQQGMGFHVTEATCYLTADLFYLEVLLLPCGGVEEVKVAPHGKSPVASESLLHLLRSRNFADFSVKLGGLFAQYDIPGDHETKLKLLASLQHLGKDLEQISYLQRDCGSQVDMINKGRIGHLITEKEDCPLTVQFYISPTDGMKTFDSETTDPEAVVQAAQVTIGVSNAAHKLQMASAILQPPQLDPRGFPVFSLSSGVLNEMLPACFLLKLQPAVPVTSPFVKKLIQITEVTVPDVDLQWAPLPKLLMRGSLSANSHLETLNEQETIFTTPLPGGVIHGYILPGASWDVAAQRGAIMDRVPFTHPAHVPPLLELLRHQCTINTLLGSCFTARCAGPGSACDLLFEVLPESDTSFSVTFHRPYADSLAVLLVTVPNPHQITCRLFGAGTFDPSLDACISTVMKRCMSIPVTMTTLYSKLAAITSAPLSLGLPTATEAENDRSAPLSTAVFSQHAAVPDDRFGVSGSGCYTMSVTKSELLPEINTSSPVSPYPFAPVGVFSHWISSNDPLSELI